MSETDPPARAGDAELIGRALELAASADYATSPNPMVGAVVLDEQGAIAGEGFHRRASELHAEVVALQQAGQRARGGTLYVNLEPCSHHGRTPPCVDALITAGVRRVVASMLDPNPLVNGEGVRRLRAAGVAVELGEGVEPARKLNAFYLKWVRQKVPFVTLKFATSLDGKIATATGQSRWISSEASREYAHLLRHRHDAIAVGINTVLADDPELTTRLGAGRLRQPIRIVLDSNLRIPLSARVLDPELPSRTVVACVEGASEERAQAVAATGAEVLRVGQRCGKVDLAHLLQILGRRGVISVLIEGGGEVHAAFLQAGLADRVAAAVAPMIIGGRTAPGAVAGEGFATLAEAVRLDHVEVRQLGGDILVEGDVHRDS